MRETNSELHYKAIRRGASMYFHKDATVRENAMVVFKMSLGYVLGFLHAFGICVKNKLLSCKERFGFCYMLLIEDVWPRK